MITNMDVLGIAPVKTYKTPEYIRNAQKRYLDKKLNRVEEQRSDEIDTNDNKKTRVSNSANCKNYRLRQKLKKLANEFDEEYVKGVLVKLGEQPRASKIIEDVKMIIGTKIGDKTLIETLLYGTKRYPMSVIQACLYHILRDKFKSMTHATTVLEVNVKTLGTAYKEFSDLYNKNINNFVIKVYDTQGDQIGSTVCSQEKLASVFPEILTNEKAL